MKNQTQQPGKPWSRRQFLTHVGMVGGAAALYETMVAMDMINVPNQDWNGPPSLSPNHGKGQSVLILGAGIGGLTTAYLLSRAGYRCQILEATSRAGGRNHTARRGSTVIEESDIHGKTLQECKFDSGLYMNLGPGRLPYHHRRVLGYCQELNVALEPYLMNTTGNLFQSDKKIKCKDDTQEKENPFKKAEIYRQLQNDTRGYIAELLAKAVNKGALDQELDNCDKENLLGLLETFGPLEKKDTRGKKRLPREAEELVYKGSQRVGCSPDPDGRKTPNVFYSCETPEKLELDQLLESEFWEDSFYDPIEFEWQPTLFQPVGGMDMIVEGFLRQVGHLIQYNAPVVKITSEDDGVTVRYLDGAKEVEVKADYCVSNIPCPVLSELDTNFNEDVTPPDRPNMEEAIQLTEFDDSCKVGWQCNTRFWENNENQIYGGISWTNDIIEQIWYPSNNYFSSKGTLTGAYCHGDNARKMQNLSLEERLKIAKQGGAKMHKEFNDNSIIPSELGLSIAWKFVPYMEGAWANWQGQQHDNHVYERLLKPFRRFYIVGDQASTLPGWQEGAMMSAEHVVELIAGLLIVEEFPDTIEAPNTLKVTQGVH
jgi:monoamine oxidase